MWTITNHTPFSALGRAVTDVAGRKQWLVAVRGTYRIGEDGRLSLLNNQSPPSHVPEYSGEPGQSSLLREADTEGDKPGVDLVVTGCAYAPKGRPVPHVGVGVWQGSVRKTLRVTGDRVWRRRFGCLRPSEPEPFVKMPIVYERAFGGQQRSEDGKLRRQHLENPVGVGLERSVGAPLPNIERTEQGGATSRKTVGLGPVDRYWAPRVRHAGTYDAAWMRDRRPLPPRDFDPRFRLAAPADQQLPASYRGGDTIEVINMTAEGYLGFVVPRVVLGFATYLQRGVHRATRHHRSSLRTIAVDAEARSVSLTWLSVLPCGDELWWLNETVVREKERQ